MNVYSSSVIIVDSPFQLLCGIEFIQVEKLNEKGDVHLIAVNNKSKENIQQIENLYKYYSQNFCSYKKIEIKNKPGVINFYYYLNRYKSITKSIDKLNVQTLMLGDYANGYFRHVANRTECKRIIALDDGFGTLKTFNSEEWCFKDKKEDCKKIISFGYYNSTKSNVELFTVFDSIVKYENTIKNNFSFLREAMIEVKKTNDSYIIGTPLVESGIIENDTYLEYLRGITEKIGNRNIIYIPHRRETDWRLREIADRFGFAVKRLAMPVELYFCMNKIIPKYIISFYSTSLYNLSKLFGSNTNIVSIKINSSHIKKGNKSIDDVYKVLAREILIDEL